MNSNLKILKNGIIDENPTLRLLLGMCPPLAITTSASNSFGMGLSTTAVLVCSNAVIAALRHVIKKEIRLPAFIVIVAGFVTIVTLILQSYIPSLYSALGIFLPLIVVNCIILGRAEMFASKNPVVPSIFDGIGMGLGFTGALIIISTIREILGSMSYFGHGFWGESSSGMLFFILPAGGFFVIGILTAFINYLSDYRLSKIKGCEGCPSAQFCAGNRKEDQVMEEVK
jgi:electron transport complex protein RnfE